MWFEVGKTECNTLKLLHPPTVKLFGSPIFTHVGVGKNIKLKLSKTVPGKGSDELC